MKKKATAANFTFVQDVEAIRERLTEVRREITSIEFDPVDQDTVQQRASALVDGLASSAKRKLAIGLERIDFNLNRALNNLAPEFCTLPVIGNTITLSKTAELSALEALALTAPEILKAAFIESVGGAAVGLAPNARPGLLAVLQDEAETLQVDEERIIREAHAAGISIAHRADAEPCILLAHDDELQ